MDALPVAIRKKVAEFLRSDPQVLVKNILNPDSYTRSFIDFITNNYLDSFCLRLCRLILSTSDPHDREMLVKFLRKKLTASGTVSRSTFPHIKRVLLQCFENETSRRVAKAICKLVSGVANESKWPELVPFMLQRFETSNAFHQETSLFLFGSVRGTLPEEMRIETEKMHSQVLKSFSSNKWRVRVAAVRTLVSYIVSLTDTSSKDSLELLNPIMDTFKDAIKNEKQKHTRKIINNFMVLVRKKPEFLMVHIDACIENMSIIAEKARREKTRHLAVQFLIPLAENNQGRAMLKNLPDKRDRIFSLLFNMVADVRDDDSWCKVEIDNQICEQTKNSSYGKESLRKFVNAKHVNIMDEKFKRKLAHHVNAADWQKRYAVSAALEQMIEGCRKKMLAHLESFAHIASRLYKDSHPCVRLAAVSFVYQLSCIFGPQLRDQHHHLVILAYAEALNNVQYPRIQAHAAWTITGFSQSCTASILETHLEVLVNSLLKLIQNGSQLLKERALTALASLATSSKVAELLHSLLESLKEKDDPMRICILEAWGELCKCLGKDFLPCMNVAMPHLLQSAALLQNDFAKELQGAISINQLKEKVTACTVICTCAANLKEDFHPWIDEVAKILIPLLKFNVQEVRIAAASAMPALLDSVKLAVERGHLPEADESPVLELCDKIIRAILKGLDMETKMENGARILGSLNAVVQTSESYIINNHATLLMDEMIYLLQSGSLRADARNFGAAQDSDAGEREFLKEVGDLMVTLIKRFKQSILLFFEKLLESITDIWVGGTANWQKLAVQIFEELAKEYGEEALRNHQAYLPFLLETCIDANKPGQQKIAAWAIGVCAEFGGTFFKNNMMDDALSSLHSAIRRLNVQRPDQELVHDAAVSALGKIYYFQFDKISDTQALSSWLGRLPLTKDLNEAKLAHHFLCGVIEKTTEVPLSNCFDLIVQVLTQILWEDRMLATEQTITHIIDLLSFFKKTYPTEWDRSWSGLLPELQRFLQPLFYDPLIAYACNKSDVDLYGSSLLVSHFGVYDSFRMI